MNDELVNIFIITTIIVCSIFIIGGLAIGLGVYFSIKKDGFVDKSDLKENNRNSSMEYGLFKPHLSSEERAGYQGEREVNHKLRMIKKIDEYLLNNILIPLKNNRTTEIDCVLISRKGIFCIETKNWSGRISGSDEGETWIQQFDDYFRKSKNQKNPVKQNENHCSTLSKVLNDRFFVENIVIFINENGTLNVNSEHAYTMRQFVRWYEDLENNILHVEEIKAIYQKLLKYTATNEELEQHKKDIQNTYKN